MEDKQSRAILILIRRTSVPHTWWCMYEHLGFHSRDLVLGAIAKCVVLPDVPEMKQGRATAF